jgi:hypothetical protein
MSEPRRSKSPPPAGSAEKKSSRSSGVIPVDKAPLPSGVGALLSPASAGGSPAEPRRKKRVSGVSKKTSSSSSSSASKSTSPAPASASTPSPVKSVAAMALEKQGETRHKKIDSMSSSLVELLQMQVDRLEIELKRKTAEVERAEKRAEEAAAAAAAAAASGGGGGGGDASGGRQLGADGPLRVELAQLRASVKSMGESEERHKTRIQQLLRSLSEEREGKEEAIRQAEMKQSTIDLCSTEMDRLESEKKELIEQLEV